MELCINPQGQIRALYAEAIPLAELGTVRIERASHVEPDQSGHWWADLAPSQGPVFGPFLTRSSALQAEVEWLEHHLLCSSSNST